MSSSARGITLSLVLLLGSVDAGRVNYASALAVEKADAEGQVQAEKVNASQEMNDNQELFTRKHRIVDESEWKLIKSKYKPQASSECQAQFAPGQSKGGADGLLAQSDNKGILMDGEQVHFCFAKGGKDKVMFTSHRLIHADGTRGFGAKLVGAKAKTVYNSYMYRAIDNFDVTTVGTFELINSDSELNVIFKEVLFGADNAPSKCAGNKCRFDFHNSVDILSIGRFLGNILKDSMQEQRDTALDFYKSETRKVEKLGKIGPLNNPHSVRFQANTTGRLQTISQAEAQGTVGNLLLEGEKIVLAFRLRWIPTAKDCFVVTNNRFILADRRNLLDSKTTMTSNWFPEMKLDRLLELLDRNLMMWTVKTAGKFDLDTEMSIYVKGVGWSYGEFWKDTDTIDLYQQFSTLALKNRIPLSPVAQKGEKANKGGGKEKGKRSGTVGRGNGKFHGGLGKR